MMKGKDFLTTTIIGGLAGILGAFIVIGLSLTMTLEPSKDILIRDFYLTENAVHVSPHHIRKAMSQGKSDFILVDLRSQEEYEREHVVGAVSIPAYASPEKSAYGDVERIVKGFSELPKDKEIIVYCYSMPCMTGRKVGKMLAEHGIYVKHLGIGWNEWRYFWTLWNHEHEWDRFKVEDFVVSGPEPGTPKMDPSYISPCVPGVFEC